MAASLLRAPGFSGSKSRVLRRLPAGDGVDALLLAILLGVPLVLFLTLSRSALMVGLTLELVAFVLLFAFPLIALSAFSISLHDGLQCSKRQR